MEVKDLCNYLVHMAERGFPLTRSSAMAFAWEITLHSGKDSCFNPELSPGEHWWTCFRKRHPELMLRKVDRLDHSRGECLDPEVVEEYFKLLKKTLEENNLINSPRCLYNCDETLTVRGKSLSL